jgi:hypothetical protein
MAIGFGVDLSLEDPIGHKAIIIIVGFTMLIAMFTAVRGMIQLYRGRKEEKKAKFIIALLGNGLGILFLIFYIITAIRIISRVL